MGRFWRAAAIAALCTIQPVTAYAQTRQRPPNYAEAERQFNLLGAKQRLTLQTLLAAEGAWPAVPNNDFSSRLFEAIADFQRRHGYAPDGVLNVEQIKALAGVVRPSFARWGLEEIWHPVRPHAIWAPRGMLGPPKPTKYGLEFRSPSNALTLSFDYIQSDMKSLYDALSSPRANIRSIDYRVLRKDFFVIVLTSHNGTRAYMRFHRDGAGMLGFHIVWAEGDPMTRGEQLATLISSSLYSRMSLGVSLPIPDLSSASPPPARVDVSRPPATQRPDASGTDRKASSGSGFFVSAGGDILTNAHVIEDCSKIEVTADGQPSTAARLIAVDKANDLALLRADLKPPKVLAFRRETARLGEAVVAFGFPLTTVLTRNGNFTLGNVTALAGMGDDTRYLQISTPIQPGNSGGPLLDGNGNVSGVVTAKLNAVRTAVATGDIPQNVNFAIKGSQAIAFLEANRVEFKTERGDALTSVELADVARLGSAFISCR